jgi:hypothetical protein
MLRDPGVWREGGRRPVAKTATRRGAKDKQTGRGRTNGEPRILGEQGERTQQRLDPSSNRSHQHKMP